MSSRILTTALLIAAVGLSVASLMVLLNRSSTASISTSADGSTNLPQTATPAPTSTTGAPLAVTSTGFLPTTTNVQVSAKPATSQPRRTTTSTTTTTRPRPTTTTTLPPKPPPSHPGGLLVLEKALGLAVMAPDGSGLTEILEGSSGGNWATHPNWSPDGKQITFAIVGVGIFVIDLDGTNKRMVVEDRGAGKPDWSPDGKQLVFVSDRHGPEKPKASRGGWFDPENLFIVNIASGQIRQLTNYDSINTHPDWSPDGKQIAFVSSMDDDWEIFVINVDSGYLRQLTQNKECDWDPKWSPSGDAIAFWACDKPASPSDSHIWVTDLNGTFLKLTHDEARNKSPAWSPEGDRLAYTVSGGSIAVWNSGTTTATGEWSDRFNWQNNGATPVLSFPVVLSSPNVTLGTR